MSRKERKKMKNVLFACNSHNVFVFSLFSEKLEVWGFFLVIHMPIFLAKLKKMLLLL